MYVSSRKETFIAVRISDVVRRQVSSFWRWRGGRRRKVWQNGQSRTRKAVSKQWMMRAQATTEAVPPEGRKEQETERRRISEKEMLL
eukprot:g13233.t1